MSSQENAAMKIQTAWHKYRDSKDTCAVCMNIIGNDCSTTKCGHKFCTGCLLQAVQRNGSCPMCRNELVKNVTEDKSGDYYDGYNNGYQNGFQNAEEDIYERMREEQDIATQHAYDDGLINGRRLGDENMHLLRKEYETKIENMEKEFQEKIENYSRVYDSICQSYYEKIKEINQEKEKRIDTGKISRTKDESYIKQLDTMIENRKIVLKTLR